MSIQFLLDIYSTPQVPLARSMAHIHASELQELSDEALLQHSIQNPGSFEVLVSRYHQYFLDRATYIVKNRDEAEDIVQDAFVRVYRFAPKFDSSAGTFKAWATTILMNVARTKYQKKAKEWERTAPLTPEHYESLSGEGKQDAIEAKDIIERAFAFLPEDVARILDLAFIKELPYREIAEREGSTEGAIKTRVHRAKKVLKGVIGEVL